jgi:putative ABC transport system permease protein
MQTFLQDLKYALRMLKKNPAFTTVAILTLAVGIGANSAIFSVVNSVLLRPLPYRQPDQLVRVYSEFPTMQLQKFWLSPPELLDIQREAKSWEAIGAWAPGGQNVGTESEPLRVTSAAITRSLIDVLGVQPERGRNFTEDEDRNGGPKVAIISHGLWQKGFGGASDIIGKQIQVNAATPPLLASCPQTLHSLRAATIRSNSSCLSNLIPRTPVVVVPLLVSDRQVETRCDTEQGAERNDELDGRLEK